MPVSISGQLPEVVPVDHKKVDLALYPVVILVLRDLQTPLVFSSRLPDKSSGGVGLKRGVFLVRARASFTWK